MLTIFTLPRPFAGPFDKIQHNALASWAALAPATKLILFGNEPGIREAAARYAARHIPDIERNSIGTPLVNHLFRSATAHTTTPYQAFINADILLDPQLPKLIDKIVRWQPRSLMVSRRWDIDLDESVAYSHGNSFSALAQRARTTGQLYSHHGMDVFIYPTGMFDAMPPFSIGWPGAKYDNWIVYSARRRNIPVVDITDAVTIIHQNHPRGGNTRPEKAQEHWISLDLLGGHGCCFDILDATHTVTSDHKITRRRRNWPEQRRRVFRLAQRLRYRFRHQFLGFRYTGANGATLNESG
jgi:hypothetical protein